MHRIITVQQHSSSATAKHLNNKESEYLKNKWVFFFSLITEETEAEQMGLTLLLVFNGF